MHVSADPAASGAGFDPGPYSSVADQRRHQAHMQAIACELERPFDEIRADYELLLCSLNAGARIKDFLPTLIAKKLREQHRRQRLPA